jgi:hypothetical protein
MTRNIRIVGVALMMISQLFLMYIHESGMRILALKDELVVLESSAGNNMTDSVLEAASKQVSKHSPQQQTRLLVHLHIGKNGGTSLDGLGRQLARETGRRFIGYRHFDWSYIDSLLETNSHTVDVITMLRHPVQRTTSHFLSAQLWMPQLRQHQNLTLTDYLHDTNLLLQTRSIWFDGQAGINWLAASHTEDWVVGNKLNASEVARRQDLYEHHAREMCLLAADRLDQTLWFGMLEDLPKSMKLLQHSLGLDYTPILTKGNQNPKHQQQHNVLSEWERQALSSLVPMDIWLYDYGQRLMDARFAAIPTGVFVPPERPPFPKMWSCASTSRSFKCVKGPLKGSYRLKSRYSSALIRKSSNE